MCRKEERGKGQGARFTAQVLPSTGGQWTAELSGPASDTVANSSLQMHGWKRWYDGRLRALILWTVTGIQLQWGGQLGGDENRHRGR